MPPLFIEGVSVFAQVHLTIRDVKIKDTEGKTFAYTIGYPIHKRFRKNKKSKLLAPHQISIR
jgi:hypothetical protein